MKRFVQPNQFAWKLIKGLIVFSSLVTLITTAVQMYSEYDRDVGAIHSRFNQIERSYLSSISENVWEADSSRLKLLINGIIEFPDFKYLAVRDENGEIFATAGQKQNERLIRKTYPLYYTYRNTEHKIGELEITASLSEVYDRMLRRIGLILVSNAIKTFLVAIFLFVMIHWLLTRHLNAMAGFARNINLELPYNTLKLDRGFLSGKHDEVDQLADTLNDMQTRLVQADKEKQKSDRNYRSILENLTETFYRTNIKGEFIMVSPSITSLLGYSMEEVLGKKVTDIYVSPDERLKLIELLTINKGKVSGYEARVRQKDGAEIWISTSSHYYYDNNGQVLGIEGIAHDITEKKIADDNLNEAQSRLSEVIDIAPEAIISISNQSIITLFNKGGERIFGYAAEEVIGQPLEILMPERFRQGHHAHVGAFLQSSEAYRLMDQRQEVMGLKKDGTEFPASASVSKSKTETENHFTVMLHDITDRRKIEEEQQKALLEAEEANRAKSEFLANMSHEFRTPLNAILGFSEILSLPNFKVAGEDKSQEYARDIYNSGEHLLGLVNEILDLSTIEAGKMSLNIEALMINDVIADSIHSVNQKAEDKGVFLEVDIPENVRPLYADKRLVRQILLNLLSNAIKFTPEHGKITVMVKQSKQKMTIKIIDTGQGIPADKLPKLTDPFNRGEQDPHKAVEGWGLGLSITKSLIDLHDGSMNIKSKVGKGTTVTVLLPNNTKGLN